MGKLTELKRIDWDAIAARARKANVLTIEASEDETSELAELTGEQLLLVLEEAGAKVEVERDADGAIESIHASVGLEAGVIEEIQATGPTPSKILGDLAQTSVDSPAVVTQGTTNSTTSVTITGGTTGIVNGMNVSGAGIPAGTTATISGSTVTLSQAATASATGVTLTFFNETQVIGLSEFTIDWKRKTADATTTDDDTYESSLGSTASWSVKAKYMFIDSDTSQANNILATITSPQSPQTWNFFPTIATGRAAFSGQAYVDGITIASGMGKVVGLDVSLKGTGKLNFLTQGAPVANPNTGTGEQAEV